MRDQFTYDSIARISRDVANRSLFVPDPTFAVHFVEPNSTKSGDKSLESGNNPADSLLGCAITPPQWFHEVAGLRHARTRRMHGVIACILGNTPVTVTCDRPKVRELCDAFAVSYEWPSRSAVDARLVEYRAIHESIRKLITALVD